MNVDLHNHVIPETFAMALADGKEDLGAQLVVKGKDRFVRHDDGGLEYPLLPELCQTEAKLETMDRRGIDIAAISPAPPMFYYTAELERATAVSRIVNDGIAEMFAAAPDRLRGIATLPMHHPEAAVAELERIARNYDCFRGVEICTSINGKQVADPCYRDVLRRAQELKMFIFGHPFYMDMSCGFGSYYFHNLIGNPLDTTMMAAHLMFSGALDELPELRVLLAHGGGYLPYQIGRLMHGHAVRGEGKVNTLTSPEKLLRSFYFDALLHHPEAIRFLIDLVGADRVVLGTDSPYDMGTTTPVATLDLVKGLTDQTRHQVCCGNAFELFNEHEDACKAHNPATRKRAFFASETG